MTETSPTQPSNTLLGAATSETLYIFCGEYLLCARLKPSSQDASTGSVEEWEREPHPGSCTLAEDTDRAPRRFRVLP